MSHCRLLFVGTKDNMEAIFENCSDSSSESKAEMAFGCDWVAPDYWYDEEFTKQDEPYQDVIKEYPNKTTENILQQIEARIKESK